MTRTAVITTVAGRHEHLHRHLLGLAATSAAADEHVVVSMGDPAIAGICAGRAHVVAIAAEPGALPLAAARNLGAATALEHGADVLVFLDVDCIAGPTVVGRYREVALGRGADALLSGGVAYLPQAPPDGWDATDHAALAAAATPNAARPAPDPRDVVAVDYDLFWSLSFAVSAPTWRRIGGFCERYVGYGAEDTDFAQLACAAGVAHLAVGGADAVHQWHDSQSPPVDHAADIVRNATVFFERWGRWPMLGWLDALRELGVVRHDAYADSWHVA